MPQDFLPRPIKEAAMVVSGAAFGFGYLFAFSKYPMTTFVLTTTYLIGTSEDKNLKNKIEQLKGPKGSLLDHEAAVNNRKAFRDTLFFCYGAFGVAGMIFDKARELRAKQRLAMR